MHGRRRWRLPGALGPATAYPEPQGRERPFRPGWEVSATVRPLPSLLQAIPGQRSGPWAGAAVSGVAIDSRRVLPGDLFAALPGQHHDGAAFLQEAVTRGAAALLLPLGVPAPAGLPALATADVRAALAAASAAFFDHPSREIDVFGVTGTNGKTTVATMLAHILERAGRRAAYWTTSEVASGARRFRPTLTTPESCDLQRFLREAADAGATAACIEVSSHGVVQRRIAELAFRGGAVTNVTADHLDFHGSVEAYRAAKAGFVRALAPGAPCLVNADDPGATAVAAGAAADVIPYGLGPGARLRGAQVEVSEQECRCLVTLPGCCTDLPLRVPLPGRHNIHNALAAFGLAVAAGIAPHAAAEALEALLPPARRLRVQRFGGRSVIDDVAMNEASFDAVCAAVAELGYPQVVAVVALRGNRGEQVNAEIAACLARWAPVLGLAPLHVSLSRRALQRYAADLQVRPEEMGAFAAAARQGGLALEIHTELDDALGAACGRLAPGGALLLLGTFGMDDGCGIAAGILGGRGTEPFPLPALG